MVVEMHLSRRMTLLVAAALNDPRVLPAVAISSLSDRLAQRDPRSLAKTVFSSVPAEARFPSWLDGEWQASLSFDGYELPAKDTLPRNDLFAEPTVPGFQKCSIALIPDVGKEGVTFPMRWFRDGSGAVREDRAANLRAAVRGGLGYDAIVRKDFPPPSFAMHSRSHSLRVMVGAC